MGLGELFDGIVREIGRTDSVQAMRAQDKNLNILFRGSESRCKKRYFEQQRIQQNYSSSNSAPGLGSLLVGAAIVGGFALLCKDDEKTETAK